MSPRRRGLSVNEHLVTGLLLDHGPLTRPDIAKAASLSRPATGDLVQRLLDRELVVEAGERETGQRGPNAMTYAIRPELAHVAGVEMQPSHVHVAVADVTGRLLAETDEPTRAGDRADTMVARALRGVTDRIGIATRELHGVVIGTPGVVTPGGDIDFVSGHADWGAGHRTRLETAIGVPVRLENDVNLAALAEQHLGAGRHARSFVLLHCNEGVGAGIVVDGVLLRGAHGYAGELGYVPLRPHYGRPEEGFQSLVARASLAVLLVSMGVTDTTPEEMLADPERHADVNEAFLVEVARRFALPCLAVCAVVDPDRLILSGTVAAAGGERLTDAITANLHDMSPMRPSVAVAQLGSGVVVAGALATALRTARDEIFGVSDRDPRPGVMQ